MYARLPVDIITDDLDTSDTVDSTSTSPTDRGPGENQLGSQEPCLIPEPNISPIYTGPKEGERFFVRTLNIEKELRMAISLTTVDTHETAQVHALLDSGATGMFIDRKYVRQQGWRTRSLQQPIKVYNVDGTLNQGGSITEEITLMVSHKGHKERAVFEITDLGKTNIIIGHTWLRKHNPEIDWHTGEVQLTRCLHECNVFIRQLKKDRKRKAIAAKWCYKASVEDVEDEEAHLYHGGIMTEDEDSILEEIDTNEDKRRE